MGFNGGRDSSAARPKNLSFANEQGVAQGEASRTNIDSDSTKAAGISGPADPENRHIMGGAGGGAGPGHATGAHPARTVIAGTYTCPMIVRRSKLSADVRDIYLSSRYCYT